ADRVSQSDLYGGAHGGRRALGDRDRVSTAGHEHAAIPAGRRDPARRAAGCAAGQRSEPARSRAPDADARRRPGMTMSCTHTPDCLCGCCRGTSVETPQAIDNLPGQLAIAYRAGTWATFRESMLARLSSADYPALAGLRTRDSDDFTIAFLDASS